MSYRVLTAAQVEQFKDRGYTVVPQAYPHEAALAAQAFLWERLSERYGIDRANPETWTKPMARINETYNAPVFKACQTQRLYDAMDDLLGEGRRRADSGDAGWGWWPVNFAFGAETPWNVPTEGWHWDGIHFRHTVTAPDQGLLTLCLFSDIAPRGGGTLAAAGSHQVVARYLARHPEGLELGPAVSECMKTHPWLAALRGATDSPCSVPNSERIAAFMDKVYTDADGTRLQVIETTGNAGDVILCHPFLIHAASPNHSGIARFMCNRTSPVTEPLNLSRPDGGYSPLEESIRTALAA